MCVTQRPNDPMTLSADPSSPWYYTVNGHVEGLQPKLLAEIEKLAVGAGPDGKVQHFHDVKWAPQRGVLHAGGISKAVATFQLGPA